MKLKSIIRNAALAAAFILTAATEADARLPRALSQAISERIERAHFSGVAQISVAGRTEYNAAFGTAERVFNTPVDLETRFPIASVTKIFTSALILQLADAGMLRLDAPFGAYLPDYPGDGGDRVSVRMLLNHTSGIAQFDTIGSYQEAFASGMPNYQRPRDSAALLNLCCNGALAAEPGARFDYNNADYFILGQIVERLTGQSFEEALRVRILEPLGLHNTGMLRWDAINPRLASTYFHREDTGALTSAMPIYWENFYAAAGMYSTAADLSRFADALFSGDIISAAARAEFLTPALDEYGLGLWVYSFERAGHAFHVAKRPGSVMGANCVLYRLLDQNVTIALIGNTNLADLDAMAQRIAEQLIDSGVGD
jgi:D-alanyl-D-alanine carboxypeptidase